MAGSSKKRLREAEGNSTSKKSKDTKAKTVGGPLTKIESSPRKGAGARSKTPNSFRKKETSTKTGDSKKPPVINGTSKLNLDELHKDLAPTEIDPPVTSDLITSTEGRDVNYRTHWCYKLLFLIALLLSATNAVTLSLWMQSEGDFQERLVASENQLEDVKEEFFFKLRDTRGAMTKECDVRLKLLEETTETKVLARGAKECDSRNAAAVKTHADEMAKLKSTLQSSCEERFKLSQNEANKLVARVRQELTADKTKLQQELASLTVALKEAQDETKLLKEQLEDTREMAQEAIVFMNDYMKGEGEDEDDYADDYEEEEEALGNIHVQA